MKKLAVVSVTDAAAMNIRSLVDVLKQDNPDVLFIVEQAQRWGFGSDTIRKQAWPFILGLKNADQFLVNGEAVPTDAAKVVDVDIPRSMHSYDITKAFDSDKREHSRKVLKSLIYKSLDLSVDPLTGVKPLPKLHYYQGYHDVVSVFQLVLGPRLGEM